MKIFKARFGKHPKWKITNKPSKKSLNSKILSFKRIPGEKMKDKISNDRLTITCDVYNNGETIGNYYLVIGRDVPEKITEQILSNLKMFTNGNYYFRYDKGAGKFLTNVVWPLKNLYRKFMNLETDFDYPEENL